MTENYFCPDCGYQLEQNNMACPICGKKNCNEIDVTGQKVDR